MNLVESFRIALRALSANKLRSALTMLGIIIGVGAVITLVSAGKGVEEYVTSRFQSLGSNLLFVVPGRLDQGGPPRERRGGQALTMGDAEAIADPLNVPDAVAVAPEVRRYATVTRGKRDVYSQVAGVTPEYEQVRNWYPALGTFITAEDVSGHTRVAVLGATVADKLFDSDEYPLGQTVKINDVLFRVVGVMEKRGGSGFGDEDNVVFVPISTAQIRLFPARSVSGDYQVSVIYVQAASEDRMAAVQQQITELLRRRHNITYRDDDDFTVVSQADLISVFGEITSVLTLFLGSIAAISLLVGGIGIMNIMLVSVTERTREIGLRKAVGAKRRDILVQFLIEAIVLALIGGFVGILLGAVGAAVVSQLAEGLRISVTLESVLLATGFSAAVGLFFGIYPATRAARLNPIEALRYE
ncbi:MAG: ABC transporter permease [Anaerolineae bacterium]|nr:ABC transporter permease [Anaerolineae bacterium]MDW8097956.1 ABC transporter permease [Anaerolineae bacterium]